ncbi:hypothetical protein ABW20_dc0103022 [Dactylellina cionopaga]|nr:hypothetical protein ABW20_dc0103022 [Dactylellina cionopaga]
MENIISSIRYLLSLNTPSISLVVECFIGTRHPERTVQVLHDFADTREFSTPLKLLETMLKYCISEAWSNAEGLPYTLLALRKDIPFQKEQRNVHRAMDIAMRCDRDYSELQSTYERVTAGNWDEWLRISGEALRNANSGTRRNEGLEDIQEFLSIIYNDGVSGDIPALYARIAYALASNGVSPYLTTLTYQGSPFAILFEYFERVIARKLESFYGAESVQTPLVRNKERFDTDKTMLSILATRRTDWDAVYKNLRTSPTGMAPVLRFEDYDKSF